MTSRSPASKATRRPLGSTDYEVGFAKPPEHTRFKPGRSGNPRGRPKGSKNKPPVLQGERMQAIILEEAYRTIRVQDAGRTVTLSMAEAIIRSLALAAAKGQQRSQRLFTELLRTTEAAKMELHDEYLKTLIEYKSGWEERIEECKRLGIEPPDPIPHPDQIVIDFANNTARVEGPMTKEEKVEWDQLREKKIEWAAKIKDVSDMLADGANEHIRDALLNELEHLQRIYAAISRVIKD